MILQIKMYAKSTHRFVQSGRHVTIHDIGWPVGCIFVIDLCYKTKDTKNHKDNVTRMSNMGCSLHRHAAI